jgi:hypothetical protein
MRCRAQLMTLTKEAKKLEANDHNYNSDLDEVIRQVKDEFKSLFAKRRDLIIKLGEAFEHTVSDSESICEEIKIALGEEIAERLISTRDIERYCPDKWKKKTRPKKEQKNDKLSISSQEQETKPQVIVGTHGNSMSESAPIPDPNSNDNYAVNHEESAKVEAEYKRNFLQTIRS